MTWKNSLINFFWRIIGLLLLLISIYVWKRLGFLAYACISAVFVMTFGYLHNFRWESLSRTQREFARESNKIIYLAVFWPASIIYFPIIFIQKERELKEQIVREIIES